jgi:hypothetical protein
MNKFSKKIIGLGFVFVGAASICAMTDQKYQELQGNVSEQDAIAIACANSREADDYNLQLAIQQSLEEVTKHGDVTQQNRNEELQNIEIDIGEYNGEFTEQEALEFAKTESLAESVFAPIDNAKQAEAKPESQLSFVVPKNKKELTDDEKNKKKSIKQLPSLSQLEGNYCGYYAAYYAICMLESTSEQDMQRRLNDRDAYNKFLKTWENEVRQVRGRSSDLSLLKAEEISLIIQKTRLKNADSGHIFVEGSVEDQIRAIDVIEDFKTNKNAKNIAFIVNASDVAGSHWFAVMARVNGEMIIADSLGSDRPETSKIKRFYGELFN